MDKLQQEKKVEELMRPRYKVIADYPTSEFLVGDIFTFSITKDYAPIDDEKEVWYDEKTGVFLRTIIKYPHLFRKLEWWEDRKPEDMPEYVKITFNGTTQFVHKVERWNGTNLHGQPIYNYINRVGNECSFCVLDLEPATLEEFEAYKLKYTHSPQKQ